MFKNTLKDLNEHTMVVPDFIRKYVEECVLIKSIRVFSNQQHRTKQNIRDLPELRRLNQTIQIHTKSPATPSRWPLQTPRDTLGLNWWLKRMLGNCDWSCTPMLPTRWDWVAQVTVTHHSWTSSKLSLLTSKLRTMTYLYESPQLRQNCDLRNRGRCQKSHDENELSESVQSWWCT